jgi:hypothetical protein
MSSTDAIRAMLAEAGVPMVTGDAARDAGISDLVSRAASDDVDAYARLIRLCERTEDGTFREAVEAVTGGQTAGIHSFRGHPKIRFGKRRDSKPAVRVMNEMGDTIGFRELRNNLGAISEFLALRASARGLALEDLLVERSRGRLARPEQVYHLTPNYLGRRYVSHPRSDAAWPVPWQRLATADA